MGCNSNVIMPAMPSGSFSSRSCASSTVLQFMTNTTPSRAVRDHHWSILPSRCRATVCRTSYGRTLAISSAGLLVLSEPIARILVVGTEKAANGGKTGTSHFDGMLGSDTGHLERSEADVVQPHAEQVRRGHTGEEASQLSERQRRRNIHYRWI